ncbi:MAG TPA: sugar nucleotide-binding protein [Acidimicrobiales bacterium]|nr:sugar nucleotide-binding protein [Acidimicrobiales bacterium]
MKEQPLYLVIGADSEVGGAVVRQLESRGRRVVATTRRADRLGPGLAHLELEDVESWRPPQGTTAACLCAGRVRLADCAEDPIGTRAINVESTTKLLDLLGQLGIYTLFLSSNQVFNGSVPRVPSDSSFSPVSEYGRQKVAVEEHLLRAMQAGQRAGILRLSRVLGPGTSTTSKWARGLLAGERVFAFSDMVLAPVPLDIVALAVSALLDERASGVFQLSGPADVSYADFARCMALALGAEAGLVEENSAANADLPAGSAPLHTTMDSQELERRYRLAVPDAHSTARLIAAQEAAVPRRFPVPLDRSAR